MTSVQLVTNARANWLHVKLIMVECCYGCGIDVTEERTERRLLCTSKSLPVLTLWKSFLDNLGDSPVGYMCRNCFSAYERYINLQKNIEEKLHKALEKIYNIITPGTPKRLRLANSEGPSVVTSVLPASAPSSSASPDVGV